MELTEQRKGPMAEVRYQMLLEGLWKKDEERHKGAKAQRHKEE